MNPYIGYHPTIGYHLNQGHMADLRHQAQRHALAHTARRARQHRSGHPSPNPAGLARRVLATLATRST